MEPDRERMRRALLAWYHVRKRDLPFRRTSDPYAILVAEIILQRTRVRAGVPYYERFLAAFPTVRDLAAAREADVLRVWEGLGFYGRARNLHRAAKAIVAECGGQVPADFDALRGLPGIGEYTAGAVGSIAFGRRVPAVDGNVTRVLARVFRIEDDPRHASARARIRSLAAALVPPDAPGEWNQALMELGATVCVPRAPKCDGCPVSDECLAFSAGVQDEIPHRPAKPVVPVVPVVFAVVERRNSILLVRRIDGLHEGMYALPGGARERGESPEDGLRRQLGFLGLRMISAERLGPIRQTFSHLRWDGAAYRCVARGEPRRAKWIPVRRLAEVPLIPLHRKLVSRVLRQTAPRGTGALA